MPYYRRVGDVPRKRHVQFRQPDGRLYQEELMGEEGFSSDSSLLYHRYAPTSIVKAETIEVGGPRLIPNLPLSPRHLRTQELSPEGDLVSGRLLLAGNADVRISYAATDSTSGLYRNSTGDECVYIATGRARLESTYGALDVGEGDYVVIPSGTIHRWVPDTPVTALAIESSGHIRPPRRYLSQFGQFLEHAPFCERDLRGPTEPLLADGEEVDVLVRTRGGLTRLTYAHHPFDVVGWDGCLYPYAFNIHDFEPLVKSTHVPPPVHQTFEGPGMVICSFCPRPMDFHPEAVPIPYNHHNVDSDEVLFYVGGDYTARRGSGIGVGSISLHPAGFTHGPQPGAVEASIEAVRQGNAQTTELAVMVDTFQPLDLGPAAANCEDPDYPWTWVTR